MLAQKPVMALIAHTARDIHPPGYYLLLHGWLNLVGDTEFALAFFSVTWGVLLIASVFRLTSFLLGDKVALWASGLVTISAYNVWYSQEVRMYTLGACCGVWVVYFALKAWSAKSEPFAWLGYIITATIGLYILYYFGFLLITLNVALILIFYKQFKVSFLKLLLANLAIVILYLPWLPIAWRQATNPPVPPWRSEIPLPMMLIESWSALSYGESVEISQIWLLLMLTLGLFGLGLYAIPSSRWRILLPMLTFAPLAIIIVVPLITHSPLYHVRYMFTYSPFFYIILAATFAWLWDPPMSPFTGGIKGGVIIVLCIIIGNGFSIYQLHTNPRYTSDDFRGAVQFIVEKWRTGDVIIVNAGYTYTAFQYYADSQAWTYSRLTNMDKNHYLDYPVFQTGTVDGLDTLGWGDERSDFYAMSKNETYHALQTVSNMYPRLWLLRSYDTVTDPHGTIRQWLDENTIQYEDHVFAGQSYIRVQGFLSKYPPAPPVQTNINFGDMIILNGFQPPPTHASAGQTIDVVAWWTAHTSLVDESPYAISLKLWDEKGTLAVQHDEWAVGNLYFTPNWKVEHTIRHPMRLILPSTIQAGQYWLDIEMYHSQSGMPLQIVGEDGHVVTLGGISIK
ncbi:MAG: hypothetical protein B6242_01815 [Anaerolineaceae bacterium 4572_78]|nr:MAG: hypothetical protein B6242_01815 [Anaerolineaceae bacterium 4572_78]